MSQRKKIKPDLKFRYLPLIDDKFTKLQNKCFKPLPQPYSIPLALFTILLQVCRRILFMEQKCRILTYCTILFFGSLITDFVPFPKSYFSNKKNIFNVYFVKYSWGWTWTLTTLFIYLTSSVYCCGNKKIIIKHLLRSVCNTIVWYVSIQFFLYIESIYGFCLDKKNPCTTKKCCYDLGLQWHGFDISGHAFLLIFCNLIIHEEAKVFKRWEYLSHTISEEDYFRQIDDGKTCLLNLSNQEFDYLKRFYFKFTFIVRIVFILLTFLSLLWDVMLIATILYFHTIYQKLSGGLIAIIISYCLYHICFPLYLEIPGNGYIKTT